MALIKSQNITPKLRWQQIVKLKHSKTKYNFFFVRQKTNHKLTLQGLKNLYGLRRLHKTYLYNFYIRKIKLVPYIIFDYGARQKPLTEFVWGKSIYNQINAFLHSELSHPGFILYPLRYIFILNKKFINQMLPLKYITLNFNMNYIFNNSNQYITYSKSSGVNSLKKIDLKKVKLARVELPSKKLKLFSINIYAILSITKNLFIHKIVEGGWGYAKTTKKVINVRGVAKNPVDHPNGGRTKSKQPELSPWGWIAKKTK